MPVYSGAALVPAARRIVETVLAVQAGEKVCIVTDTERPAAITEALMGAGVSSGAEVVVVVMLPRDMGGVEPPDVVRAAMEAADAVILQTSYALTHTNAARAILGNHGRFVDMWGCTEEMLLHGGMTANYDWVRDVTVELSRQAAEAAEMRLTTPDGTNLRFDVRGRTIVSLVGSATQAGSFCALPDGEMAVSPLEGSAEGVLVDPFVIERRGIEWPKDPIRVSFEDGIVTRIEGGQEAQELDALLATTPPSAKNLAEFAIGTNPACRIGVTMRENKKALTTAHIAIGDNRSLGGVVDSPLHIDMIVKRPTVTFDGRVVLDDGKLLVADAMDVPVG